MYSVKYFCKKKGGLQNKYDYRCPDFDQIVLFSCEFSLFVRRYLGFLEVQIAPLVIVALGFGFTYFALLLMAIDMSLNSKTRYCPSAGFIGCSP